MGETIGWIDPEYLKQKEKGDKKPQEGEKPKAK